MFSDKDPDELAALANWFTAIGSVLNAIASQKELDQKKCEQKKQCDALKQQIHQLNEQAQDLKKQAEDLECQLDQKK